MAQTGSNPSEKSVEELYLEHNWSLGEGGRTARMFNISAEVRAIVRRDIALENPGLSERELRIRTAERIYWNDPLALRALKEMRDDP